uniref:HlyD family secretion protein n=1 Tax=Thaumasiovibrio subtropicus TaxID=1891207 RepID=UPI00131C4199|nr:HlyD family efflux transporter periplasmic adaptor subunit [Thaumasiovibrio subtropicus]
MTNRSYDLSKKRTTLKKEEVKSYESLLDGNFISELAYQNSLIDLAELEAIEEEKSLSVRRLERELSQLEFTLAQLELQGELRKSQLERQSDEILAQIVQLSSSSATVIKASLDGTITGLRAEVGQTVSEVDVLASIIPADSELLVELYSPSHSIGFVKANQNVGLRFPTFPYEKFGIQSGSVKQISRSTYSPSEISQLRSVVRKDQEALFKILVSLEKDTVTVYGNEEPLKIGMLVSADINVEKRNLSEWLLGPITGLHRKTLWN